MPHVDLNIYIHPLSMPSAGLTAAFLVPLAVSLSYLETFQFIQPILTLMEIIAYLLFLLHNEFKLVIAV